MERGSAFRPLPRNEADIIHEARKSGRFLPSGPSRRAAYMAQYERMYANEQVRATQERRRAMQEAQRTSMDYDRVLGEQAASTIPPLRTFRHQMNNRQRMAEEVANQVNDPGIGRSDSQRIQDAGGAQIFDYM